MKITPILAGMLLAAVAGCFTVSETEYPQVEVPQAPNGNPVRVKLQNFRTGNRVYSPVEGHETMEGANPDIYVSMMSQASKEEKGGKGSMLSSASANIVGRTVRELKRKGYVIDRESPQYVISLEFFGPKLPDNDVLHQLGYMFGTLFTAEKFELSWTAELKVLDSTGEKVLFSKNYEQDYRLVVWGPIPVASPACAPKNNITAANSWAITALGDVAVTDAMKFICGDVKK